MRNLTRRELSIISGGMNDQTSRNHVGSQLTCGALAIVFAIDNTLWRREALCRHELDVARGIVRSS